MSLSAAIEALIPFADVPAAARPLNPAYVAAVALLSAELGLGAPPPPPAAPNEYGTHWFAIRTPAGYWRGLDNQDGPLEFAARFYDHPDAQRVISGQAISGASVERHGAAAVASEPMAPLDMPEGMTNAEAAALERGRAEYERVIEKFGQENDKRRRNVAGMKAETAAAAAHGEPATLLEAAGNLRYKAGIGNNEDGA